MDENMGMMLICERSNEGYENFKNYEVSNKNGNFSVTYEQVLQSFDVQNRNGRYYDGDNVWDCIIHSPKIQSQLAHNGWFMELDHPFSYYKNKELSPERIQNAVYDRRCAVIKKPRREGNLLKATITTTSNDLGVALAKDIDGIDYRPMASLRAIATIQNKNGKPYAKVKKVITYDTVSFASHQEADMVDKPFGRFNNFIESVKDSISNITYDIAVPIKELFSNIGNSDMNTSMILESFDLSENDLIGIDKSRTHSIIQMENNIIYADLSPQSIHKVNDFFASL